MTFSDMAGCCFVQSVNIDKLGEDESAPFTLTRLTPFTIQGSVGDSCEVANGTLLEWRITEISGIMDNSSTVVSSGKTEWKIEKRTVDVGLYRVEFRSWLASAPDVNKTAYAYIRIKPSSLVAAIAGGGYILHGYGEPITLNASESHDPDFGERNHTGMKFTWLCKMSNETYPDHVYLPTTNLTVISFQGDGSGGLGGCFGTGVGKLNTSSPEIKVDQKC